MFKTILTLLCLLLLTSASLATINFTPSEVYVNTAVTFRIIPLRGCDFSREVISWDFGDGQRISEKGLLSVTHKYQHPGTYTVVVSSGGGRCRISERLRLEVKDLICQGSLRIWPRPASVNQKVNLELRSSGVRVYRVSFDFGDGQKVESTSPRVEHIYKKAGTYTVVVEGWGRSSRGECKIGPLRERLRVREKIKTYSVRILYSPSHPRQGEEVVFKVVSPFSPLPETFYWEFGDGSKQLNTEATVFHKFNQPGNYKITVSGKAKLPSGEICILNGVPLYISVLPSKKEVAISPEKALAIAPEKEEEESPIEEVLPGELQIQNIKVFNERGKELAFFRGVYLAGDSHEVKVEGEVISSYQETVECSLRIKDKQSNEVYYQESFSLAPLSSKKFQQEIELDKISKTIEIECFQIKAFPLAVTAKGKPQMLKAASRILQIKRKPQTAPQYFTIAGFVFWIDSFWEKPNGEIEGSAHTIIPFKFLKAGPSPTKMISGGKTSPLEAPISIQEAVGKVDSLSKDFLTQYTSSGTTFGGESGLEVTTPQGEVVYVDLKEIDYKNFVLDEKNNVQSGYFTIEIKSFLDTPQTELLYLDKISFFPQEAVATCNLNLGEKFGNVSLTFKGQVFPSFSLYSGTLKLQQQVVISNPFSLEALLTLSPDSTKLVLENGKIISSQIQGEVKLPKFSPFTYQINSGKFVFQKQKVGLLLDEVKLHISALDKEVDLPVEKHVFVDIYVPGQPEGGGSSLPSSMMAISPGEIQKIYAFTLQAEKIVVDLADFANFTFDNASPSWVGAAVFNPRIKLPVELETVEENKLIFKGDKKVDITEGDIKISGKFYKDGEQTFTLLNPNGFKVKVKNGSYIYLNNNLISYPYCLMLVDLIFPDYLEVEGKPLSINLDGLVNPDLKIQRQISYGGIVKLKKKPSLGLSDLKMEINIGKGLKNEIKFKEGKVFYLPYYSAVFAPMNESFKINSAGLWGEAINEDLNFKTQFQGFPIEIKKFEVKFNASSINKLKVSGWIRFDSLGGIKRPFLGNFKWDENKIQILSGPLTDGGNNFLSEVYDGHFFEIDIQGGNLEKFWQAELNVNLKVKIFGFQKTYNLYNFKTSPTKIAEILFTIGDNWDFFGLKALLPKGKLYVEGDKIVLEVKPKFSLGEGWLSFPMETKVKFKSDGSIESSEAGGNINIDLPQVKFEGKIKFNYDDEEGIKLTGGGKLKLLDSGVGVESDFLYAHEFNKDYDYFKIFAKAEGFQIPLGIGMSFYGLGGGFAYNMKIDVDPLNFNVKFTPQKNNLGFVAAVDLGTDDNGYTFYSKGTLNISFTTSGSTGEIGIVADAWVFKEEHEGKPPLKASLEFGWGDKTELLIAVGMKYEKEGVIKLPKGGGYNTGVIHADSSGVEVKLGEKSNPWSAKLFNLLDGNAYLTLDVKANHVGGTLGGKVSVKKETSSSICDPTGFLGCCKIYAGISGKCGFDVIIDFYPNFYLDYTGEISANAYAGCCVGKLSLAGSILLHISAPEPADFTVTLKVPYDIWIDSGTIEFSLDIV